MYNTRGSDKNQSEGFGLTILEAINYECIPLSLDMEGLDQISKIAQLPTFLGDVKSLADF